MGGCAQELCEHALQHLKPDHNGKRKNLKAAFEFSTGTTHGNEAAPLIVNNTMYIVTPFPNDLYALDLTKSGAPIK